MQYLLCDILLGQKKPAEAGSWLFLLRGMSYPSQRLGCQCELLIVCSYFVLLDLRSSPTGLSIFLLLTLSKPFRPIISIPKSGSTDSVTVSLGTQTHIRLWWTCRHTIAGSRILFCLLHTVLTCSIYLFVSVVNLWCLHSQILDSIVLCLFDACGPCQ
jgi:hypothetical protein